MRQPNLVIILADDMGYGDSSAYGGWIHTPHMEALAEEGTRFSDFHSSGTVCSPTRAGLLTGRYQQRAGIAEVINADPAHPAHQLGLSPSEVTFPKLLREAGYASAIFGKWHLGYTRNFNPLHHGFARFRGYVSGNIDYISHYDRMGTYDWWEGLEHIQEEGYTTHLITEHSVEFIEQHRDEPFCLFVSHEAVHTPLQGPNDPAHRGPGGNLSGIRVDNPRETYRQMMVAMDDSIGAIVDTIHRAGIAEDTFVFFFSDNGGVAPGSNGPLRGQKGQVWEGGHRVPAIARWPGKIPGGVVADDLSISLDLMPTMLELADVDAPCGHRLDGRSLVPLLLNQQPVGHRQLFWNGRAMRDNQWKLVRGPNGPALYDLSFDIGEQADLADAHPEQMRQMESAIEAWCEDVRA